MTQRLPAFLALVLAAGLAGLAASPSAGQQEPTPPPAGEEEPLPEGVPVIEVDAPERSLYKIAIPNLEGSGGGPAADVIRNDLELVSLFEVLDSRSFVANLASEGLGIAPASWSAVGAQGVVKGRIEGSGQLTVEMRFYQVASGASPALSKTYRGSQRELRGFMHDFANEILRVLTGQAGAFDSRIVFARRVGPGRKDVYVASWDGASVQRVSEPSGVNMLPNFGPNGVWYSRLTETGMYITHSRAEGRRIIDGDGLNMGPSICGRRVYFTSTRDGNSEIYSANLDGSGVRRVTNHPAIDVSPTCAGGSRIAFVSTRHGSPQIFMMNASGSGVRRVTYRGSHNQTPAVCTSGGETLLAFTGRSGGLDIFTVNLATQEYTRLTQGQGENKDPAFSPDCRMLAFYSSRGGIYVSSPQGLNHNRVIQGHAETLRWR
ncbi:MAG: hypothetical protein AAGH15_07210 [Myxococcota bacterium]